MKYSVLLTSLLVLTLQAADSSIIVHNETDKNLYGTVYYLNDSAETINSLYDMPAHSMVALPRPVKKRLSTWSPFYYDRELVFVPSKSMLKQKLSKQEFQRLPHTNVGDKQVLIKPDIYIVEDDGQLKGYNWQEWSIQEPILRAAGKLYKKTQEVAAQVAEGVQDLAAQFKQGVKDYYKQFVHENPYKDTVARVQIGNALSTDERAWMVKRETQVKKGLEKLLGKTLAPGTYIPKIAIAGSGGGYRAMLCTTGSLVGASRIDLLDSCMWMAGLSGSTWAIGLWTTNNMPIAEFRDLICTKVNKQLQDISPDQAQQLVEFLMTKYAQDQELTLVDIYGGLLANRLLDNFGNQKYKQYLSHQAAVINNGMWPLPIYTAIRTRKNDPAEWYEYTPYQIGSPELGMYVSTWAFGRKFKDGASIDAVLEQSLGFQLGTFGSAFAIRFDKLYDTFKEKFSQKELLAAVEMVFNEIAKEQVQEIGTKRIKWSWADIPNFTVGLAQSSIKDLPVIKLSDAGLDFNLPYPPLSGQRAERKADIIIFLDASQNVKGAPELLKVAEYARRNGLKFPSVTQTQFDDHACVVFKDEKDPEAPVIIYLPRIRDNQLWLAHKDQPDFSEYKTLIESFDPETCVEKGYCSTMNFVYTVDQARQLCALAEFNMRASKPAIVEAINWVIERRTVAR